MSKDMKQMNKNSKHSWSYVEVHNKRNNLEEQNVQHPKIKKISKGCFKKRKE